MAVKGFYFSLDAVLGLAVIGIAVSLVTLGVDTGLSEEQIRFSSYSDQAVDTGYLMQNENIQSLPEDDRTDLIENTELEEEDANRSIINTVMVLEEREDDYSLEFAENYLKEFDYASGLYYRNNNGLEPLIELDADTASSSSFVATGDEKPYEIVVVVGE